MVEFYLIRVMGLPEVELGAAVTPGDGKGGEVVEATADEGDGEDVGVGDEGEDCLE